VGRPNSTEPEIVSGYVLSNFREPADEVRQLIRAAADETERLLEEITGPERQAD
jgi:PTH1 family peptidyl-tRNA hydrolase